MHVLLDPNARPVVAHRGAAARSPENTLRAFELALEEGADALELDVHTTADDVAVVVHDPTLDRTTNATGAVATLPLDRVRAADAGARFSSDGGRTFPWRGRGLHIPTLDEVLVSFPTTPLIVEIKTARAQQAVRRTLMERRAADRCIVMSFLENALTLFRESTWLTGASTADVRRLLLHAALGRPLRDVPYRALSIPERWRGLPLPIRKIVAVARLAEKPVHIWTVDAPIRAQRLWRAGISGIVTNDPARIVAARARL
jgi:glycerophosphoryl diester phosphodiesterase